MTFIVKQPYIKVIREVGSVEKIEYEDERFIYLYEDKIVTEHREFPLADVFDLSYRKVGGQGGLLFIHTNHSLYSYTVKSSPEYFIDICKRYITNI